MKVSVWVWRKLFLLLTFICFMAFSFTSCWGFMIGAISSMFATIFFLKK